MAITVDATVAGTSANSYVTVAEVDTYFEGHLYATNWTGATSGNKDIAVVMATRLIDEWVDWIGYKATEEQALRFPRYDVQDRDGYTFDSDIIPQFLKNAIAEEAMYLLGTNALAEPDTKGFKELGVGSLKLVVDKMDRDDVTAIPDNVKAILEPYGTIRSRAGSATVGLNRV